MGEIINPAFPGAWSNGWLLKTGDPGRDRLVGGCPNSRLSDDEEACLGTVN